MSGGADQSSTEKVSACAGRRPSAGSDGDGGAPRHGTFKRGSSEQVHAGKGVVYDQSHAWCEILALPEC